MCQHLLHSRAVGRSKNLGGKGVMQGLLKEKVLLLVSPAKIWKGGGTIDPPGYSGSDGPAFHLEVTMGHRLRKSFVRNAFIPDLEVNNKSKGYGVSQRLKKSKSWNQIKITYKNNFHGFRTNLGNQAEAQGQKI